MSHREEFTVDQSLRLQALHAAITFVDLGKFGVASKEEGWPQVEDVLSAANKFYVFIAGEQSAKPGPNIVASPVGIGPDNSSER